MLAHPLKLGFFQSVCMFVLTGTCFVFLFAHPSGCASDFMVISSTREGLSKVWSISDQFGGSSAWLRNAQRSNSMKDQQLLVELLKGRTPVLFTIGW